MVPNPDVMLTISDLSKRYKSFSFGPIRFQLEPGAVVALVGPNGSGKSTFFRMIMKLIQQDNGTVKWFGEPFDQDEAAIKQNIGYVSSGLYDIFGHLSIRELASLISHWYPKWDNDRFHELIGRYEIDLKMKYAKCSTGTKKKIDFILAVVHQPTLLLLDEPSAGVDMMSQRKMKEDLLNFMENGRNSIIIATHQQEEIQQICDFIYVLQQGQLIGSFEKDEARHRWARLWVESLPESLRRHPNVKEIYEQPLQIVTDHLPAVDQILHSEGIAITHTQRLELSEVIEYILEEDRNRNKQNH